MLLSLLLCVCPQLQAPSVKGFDFAKLHLGQHSKDDVMVIQEPVPSGPGPLSLKDGLSPSENGEIPTPVSKTSTKASRSGRRRERSVLLEVQEQLRLENQLTVSQKKTTLDCVCMGCVIAYTTTLTSFVLKLHSSRCFALLLSPDYSLSVMAVQRYLFRHFTACFCFCYL